MQLIQIIDKNDKDNYHYFFGNSYYKLHKYDHAINYQIYKYSTLINKIEFNNLKFIIFEFNSLDSLNEIFNILCLRSVN